jgi:prevent-host-death family protein
MEEIAISKFKATCLAVLERVRTTGEPVRITRFGQPVAEVLPPAAESVQRKLGWFADLPGAPSDEDLLSPLPWDESETVKEWDKIEAHHQANEAKIPTETPRREKTQANRGHGK